MTSKIIFILENTIKWLAHSNLLGVVLLLCVFSIFCVILLQPFTYPIKISNFFLTMLLSMAYIILWFYLFILLRILYISENKSVDLKKIGTFIYEKFIISDSSRLEKFVLLLLILVIIQVILIILSCCVIAEHKIWQLYLYYAHIHTIEIYHNFSSKFLRFCFYFKYNLTYVLFCKKLGGILKIDYLKIKKYAKYYLQGGAVSFIAIECYINNFCLHYYYYYFLVYICCMSWIKISNIIDNNTMNFTSCMVIEMYYGAPKIIYVNLDTREEDYLKLFARYPGYPDKLPEMSQLLIQSEDGLTYHFIEFFRKFTWDEALNFYINANVGKAFYLTDLQKIDNKYFVEDKIEPVNKNEK